MKLKKLVALGSAALLGVAAIACVSFFLLDFFGVPIFKPQTTTFSFAGIPFAADGVFFAIDRSGSMMDTGEFLRAKSELIDLISKFTRGVDFGVVFFDRSVCKFPTSTQPARATGKNKKEAIEFINRISRGNASCMYKGLREALNFASRSKGKRKVIFYLGDGGGTCSGSNELTYLRNTVDQITEENEGLVKIHCVGIRMGNSRKMQEKYLVQLAEQNNGCYLKVN